MVKVRTILTMFGQLRFIVYPKKLIYESLRVHYAAS
jgi:hypothetical protein